MPTRPTCAQNRPPHATCRTHPCREIYPSQLQLNQAYASEAFALPVEELLSERSLAVRFSTHTHSSDIRKLMQLSGAAACSLLVCSAACVSLSRVKLN